MYGVGGRTSGIMKTSYEWSEASVRVDNKESEMFRVKVGLWQKGVTSPWL